MTAPRTIDRQDFLPRAECADCPWHRASDDLSTWGAVRAAARRHAASRGHAVQAFPGTVYTYAPAPAPRRAGHV